MKPGRTHFAGAMLLAGALFLSSGASPARPADILSGEDAVILEETVEIDIRSVEVAVVRKSRRTQALTPHGAEEQGGVAVGYNAWESIRSLRGSVELPQGKRVEVKKQFIVDSAQFGSYDLYSDSKQRTLIFPGAVTGAILEYSYEKEVRNLFFLPGGISLQEEIPIRSRTLIVSAPASFPLRISTRGGNPEYTRTEESGRVTHRWHVRDVPAFKIETDMPPIEDVLGEVRVSPKEIIWDGTRIDASTWNGIASWDWSLARERMNPTPEVAQAARELTEGITDSMEQIRRLYDFVRSKVTYVSIQLGIGGWQPHHAADVLRHRYGDCKDKATLLIAMMRSLGLKGYPVLIRTRDEGLIDRDDPSSAFNHEIVAVPHEGGYLFMDPTWEKAPFGDLPYTDQGTTVLVVKDDGQGDLVETPLFPPENNGMHRMVTASIGPTGDLTGTYVSDYRGQPRLEMLNRLDSKPTEREDFIEGLMSWLCPGAVLKAHEVTLPSRPEDPLRVIIRFEVPRFVTRAGNFEVLSPYLVRFPFLTRIAAYSGRRVPVFFDYPYSVTSETRLRLPVGRTLRKTPADREVTGPGLTASTKHVLVREGDYFFLVVKRAVTVSRREIPVAEYQALREFLSGLSQEESKAVTLETPAAALALPGSRETHSTLSGR